MRKFTLLFIFLFISLLQLSYTKEGIKTFDLKEWNPNGKEVFSLKGNWSFVWDKLVGPEEFLKDGLPYSDKKNRLMPGRWVNYEGLSLKNRFGKATFVATLTNVPPNKVLFFNVVQVYSAFKIFFIQKGKLVGIWENGKIGHSKKEEIPGKYNALKSLAFGEGDITLIMHLTNNHLHTGMIGKVFNLGTENNIYIEDQKRKIISTIVFSILLIMGVYHLLFWFIRKKDQSLLWFGIFCTAAAIRTGSVESLFEYFSDTSSLKFVLNHRVGYISLYLYLPAFASYLRGLIRDYVPKTFEIFVWSFNIIYLFTALLPSQFVGNLLLGRAWQLLTISMAFLFVVFLIRATYKKAPYGKLLLFPLIVAVGTGTYDVVAILFEFGLKDISTWGFVFFVITQSYLLSMKFSNAFDMAESMKENLEETVKERTTDLELQAIELEDLMEKIFYQKKARDDLLSHIGDAYMVFNKEGIIQEGSNQKSETMFECDLFESEARKIKIWDILRLKDESIETFKKWINNVYKGSISFKDLLPFAPKHFEDNNFIELQFRPIYKNEKNKVVEKVICIGSDKTKEKMIEEKMEKDRLKFEFVTNCLRSPVEFIDLIDEVFDLFRNWFNLKKQDKETLFRTFHNLKAKLSQFSIKSSAIIIHDIETHIMEEKRHLIEKRFQDLQEEMKLFLKENRMIVEAANKYIVAEGHAIRINELIDQAKKFKSIEELLEYINRNYVLRDIKDKFKIFGPVVKEISEKLGKSASFEISGEKLLLDLSQYESFLNSSIHIVRNMLDHGLETEEERVEAGKEKVGKITISIQKKEESVRISFQDDGRGINLSKLRFIIIENGLGKEKEVNNMKPKELFQFLFNPLFSTKEDVSELSGRGVGLDIIKKEVDNLKGTIEVLSTEGKGTQFIIELPLLK